jgi:hypothetical protein
LPDDPVDAPNQDHDEADSRSPDGWYVNSIIIPGCRGHLHSVLMGAMAAYLHSRAFRFQ